MSEPKTIALPEPQELRRHNFRALYHLGPTHKLTGTPVVGGQVHVFFRDTKIPYRTYMNVERTIVNCHPVMLNVDGEADIFIEDGTPLTVDIRDFKGNPVTIYTV